MFISNIINTWLKYPYNIHQEINKYLGIIPITPTQSSIKKPCLYKEVVFTSGKIIGKVCITKKITKKSLKKSIHEILVKYNPSIKYHEFTHKVFISWTQSIDEVLDEDLFQLIVESQHELCIYPGIFDVSKMKCLRTFGGATGHSSFVWSVSWDPSGKYLASGSADHSIKLWDTNTEKCVCTLTGHSSFVWSVSWDPSGTYLASGSSDHSIKLWDVNTEKCLHTFGGATGHSNYVCSVSWDPSGKYLASGSQDKTLKLWGCK